jgi:large conductance mechanosensitive channel
MDKTGKPNGAGQANGAAGRQPNAGGAERAEGRRRRKERREKTARGIMQEFREFALRGNMVDMAVGIVVGAAFNAIVQSFVNNIMMPVVGALTSGQNFIDLQLVIGGVDFRYGMFIQSVVDFLLIALSVFIMVKVINRLRSTPKAEEDETPPEPTQTELLTAIRDLLEAQRKA